MFYDKNTCVMRKFRLLAFAMAYTVLSLSLYSCNDPGEVHKEPAVILEKEAVYATSLTFTIRPADAQKCAWVCVAAGTEIPTAARILSDGTGADAIKESTVTASGLEPATEYVIVAAVSGKGGTAVSEKLIMTTLDAAQETETVELTLDKAVRDQENSIPGEYRILLTGAEGKYDLTLDMFAATDSEVLPAATYSVADDTKPGTLGKKGSSLKIKGEKDENTFVSGSVKVSVLAGLYTLDVNLTSVAGCTFKGVFTGKIENMEVDEPEGPYEMTFTNVVCDNEYAVPGEFYIIMKDADGMHELILDVFAAEDAVALPAGTYKLGSGDMYLNDEYTFLKIKPEGATNTTVVMFGEGTVEVSNDNGMYTLDISLVAEEDGRIYESRFEGKITGMPVEPSETVEFTVDEASLHFNSDPAAGNFYIKLNDKSWKYEMGLDFYAAPGSQSLPAGTYTIGEEGVPGSLGKSSYLDTYNPSSNNYFQSGTVTVTKAGGVYTFEMSLLGRDDNRLFNGRFEGVVKDMPSEPAGEEYGFTLTDANMHFNSDPATGNFYIKLNDKSWNHEMALDFYAAPGSPNLSAGTYIIGEDNEENSLGKSSYLTVYNPYSNNYFSSGSVIVAKEGDTYTFDMNLVGRDDNRVFKGSFTGRIKDMPSDPVAEAYEFVMTAAKYHFNTDPAAGRFYVKLNDAAWDHEMSLDFYVSPGTESLPAGTYTVGENGVAGNLGTASCLDIYKPYSSNYFKSGSVAVSKDGDTYTFDMELTGRDDDRLFKGSFEGTIASDDL